MPKAEGSAGRPYSWRVRSCDTGRYGAFRWPGVVVTSVPPHTNTDSLFRMAGQLLQVVAVPLALALARYERPEARLGALIAVDAPLACLRALVEAQVAMNVVEATWAPPGASGGEQPTAAVGAELRALNQAAAAAWVAAGADHALYRGVSHALLHARSEGQAPFIVLCSIPEKEFVLLVTRDAGAHAPANSAAFLRSIPGLEAEGAVLSWPLQDFPREMELPAVLCERPGCECEAARPAHAAGYGGHVPPSVREHEQRVQDAGKARWRAQHADAVAEQVAAMRATGQGGDDAEAELYRSVEAEMLQALRAELAPKPAALKRCTRCALAAYCSKACQTDDWARHKLACVAKPK